MNQRRTLHVLNGQAMYDFYKRTGFLDGELITPFNEAMCFGDTCGDIFSREFIELRAKVHGVSVDQYHDITIKPLSGLLRLDFTDLSLWFDEDMFCQINVLTILAWLDQTEYKGTIELCTVDDKFAFKECVTIKAEGYYTIYEQVLIRKKAPQTIQPPSLKTGVELYLGYLNEDSELKKFVYKHQALSEEELILKLLKEFKEYGLGDTQYLEIIRDVRNN